MSIKVFEKHLSFITFVGYKIEKRDSRVKSV